MNYRWFDLTCWVSMLYLHILPYWVVLTYIYALIVSFAVVVACRLPRKAYSFFKLYICVATISLGTFFLECVINHIFTVLMRFNDSRFYNQGAIGHSMYENATLFAFTLISVCFCVYISYKLNMRYSLQYIVATWRNRGRIILLISILTSPLVFFIPIKEIIQSLIRW